MSRRGWCRSGRGSGRRPAKREKSKEEEMYVGRSPEVEKCWDLPGLLEITMYTGILFIILRRVVHGQN